jgi:hypothetical protein
VIKLIAAGNAALVAVVLSTVAMAAESACPRTGGSAYCCAQQEPPFSDDPANYRWHADSKMCEGLISVPFGATELSLIGLMNEPVPSDAELKSLKPTERVTISIPDLPPAVGKLIRMRGASLSGGRYFMAADLSDDKSKTWDIKQFREHAALLSFDFVAFHPADQQTGVDVVYVPVRLALPSKPTGKGLRVRLLAARPFEGARATYLPLGGDLKPDLTKQEVALPSQTTSLRQLVVHVPDGPPSAFRLLVRTCLRKDDNCDLMNSTAATFDIVTSR